MLREFLEKYETDMLKKGKFTKKLQPEEWKKLTRTLLLFLSLLLVVCGALIFQALS